MVRRGLSVVDITALHTGHSINGLLNDQWNRSMKTATTCGIDHRPNLTDDGQADVCISFISTTKPFSLCHCHCYVT